jgi:Holliday junction resolvasome RuvABC endonuclease subunit
MEDLSLEYRGLEFIVIPQVKEKQITYSGIERQKAARYARLVDAFVDRLAEITKADQSGGPVIISIEGMAYGAQGNALIDIAQSTGMLKKTILDRILNGVIDSMFIFSPGELKNAIGAKGNAGKYDIYEKFKDSPGLAAGSDLHNAVLKYETEILKDQTVKSPFADMIDSYLAVLKIHESM